MPKIDQDKIVILDFGSQYTQLIARRIREIGVLSEIVSCEITPKELSKLNPRGIIFSGGPESVNSKFKPKFNSPFPFIEQSFGSKTKTFASESLSFEILNLSFSIDLFS